MTRSDLTTKMSLRLKISKKEAGPYLTAFLDSIMETLGRDGRVVMQGFGSFNLREYNARVSNKPLTGETIYLPMRKKAAFHPGKKLRELINNNTQPVSVVEEVSCRPILETTPAFHNVHGTSKPAMAAK